MLVHACSASSHLLLVRLSGLASQRIVASVELCASCMATVSALQVKINVAELINVILEQSWWLIAEELVANGWSSHETGCSMCMSSR